jgi:pSer/pThr/pTyr-binding forkhead associated (FHA) protein
MNPQATGEPQPRDLHGSAASVDMSAPRLIFPDGQEWPLTSESIAIGRRVGNHILVKNSLVSAEHAKIVHVDKDYLLLDLRSSNGTFVNGQRVRDLHVLREGDQIEVGDQQFQFRGAPTLGSHGPSPPPVAAGSNQENEGELGVLLFKELLLNNQELTIGRSADNDFVLDDPRVSSDHAKIIRVGIDYWLLDLRSSNGTFVNEQRVRDVYRLRDGDTIAIAATMLTFVRRKFGLDPEGEPLHETAPSFVFADVSGRRWKHVRIVAAVLILLAIAFTAMFVRFVMR